jgi:hypothetical protein
MTLDPTGDDASLNEDSVVLYVRFRTAVQKQNPGAATETELSTALRMACNEVILLQKRQRRFYKPDGTFDEIDDPGEVIAKRIAAARRLRDLEGLLQKVLAMRQSFPTPDIVAVRQEAFRLAGLCEGGYHRSVCHFEVDEALYDSSHPYCGVCGRAK